MHLGRSTKELTIINEPGIRPSAGIVSPGVFVSLVDISSQDYSGFEGSVWFRLPGSPVDSGVFSAG